MEIATQLGPPTVLFHNGDQAYRAAGSRIAGAPGTEEHQAMFLQDFIRKYDERPETAGWVISSLADYRDPSNFAGPNPFARRNGLLRDDREPKLSYNAVSQLLREGKTSEIEMRRRRLPITSFAKILAVAWLIAAAVFLAFEPRHYINLAYNPSAFIQGHVAAWQVIFFMTIITAINVAILIYRFFRTAPRKLLGSIDMPFIILISYIFRSEATLFIWSYLSIIWFWVFDATLVHFFLPCLARRRSSCVQPVENISVLRRIGHDRDSGVCDNRAGRGFCRVRNCGRNEIPHTQIRAQHAMTTGGRSTQLKLEILAVELLFRLALLMIEGGFNGGGGLSGHGAD